MEEKKDSANLANMSDVFNNKTFRYRINGFAHACQMKDVGVLRNSFVLFNKNGFDNMNNSNKNDDGYFIAVNQDNNSHGNSVTLSGKYHDLSFKFINYYHKERLNQKIVDIPFYISLEKKIDNDTYKFEIETIEGMRTKFSMVKYTEFKDHTLHDDLYFYANVMDFSKILKLVKGFVYNPQLGFNTYNEIIHQQKIVFTNSMLDKMVMQDEKLDKPTSKVKKIMRRILNND